MVDEFVVRFCMYVDGDLIGYCVVGVEECCFYVEEVGVFFFECLYCGVFF